MKKFDVLPEKDHLLYVGLNKVGSSSSNQIHIAHRLVQKNHLEFGKWTWNDRHKKNKAEVLGELRIL